jgi:hypothetical protein
MSSRYTDWKIIFVSNAPDIWKSVDVYDCSQVLPHEKSKKMKISVEHWWIDIGREILISEKYLSQCRRSYQD